ADAGRICEARRLFDEMPERNAVSWNSMIAGLIRNEDLEEARRVFDAMPEKNAVSWNAIISGYAVNCRMEEASVLFEKMEDRNVITWTSMIAGYCRRGEVDEGFLLFQRMPERNVVSWTAMIGGFTWNGLFEEALLLFIAMKKNSEIRPNGETFISLAYACAGLRFPCLGKQLHAQLIFNGIECDVYDGRLSRSLVHMYCSFAKAGYLFNSLPEKDAIAWTAMISGNVQNEHFVEAACLFSEMCAHGVIPLNATYSTLLGAAGALANFDMGRQLHCMLMKTQYIFDVILDNSLISMYAKCGVIDDAYRIFSKMVYRDLVSWNSMIMGYSHHGLAKEALMVFEGMLKSGTHQNSVTLLGILSACSHAGFVSQGLELFNSMSDVYAIQPSLEHYICIINLLGRAGKVKEAEEFVLGLPFKPDHVIWGTLLGVCGLSGTNNEIASRAAKRLLELDPCNAPAHVVLCNIYVANGQLSEEKKLRKEMALKGVRKFPGCSWIIINGTFHVFLSGDKLNPQAAKI
ncbi:PPR domain-containing protein/PPR_1 domain-containing protein/PPR_2 domain-containing protein, partial [Cephalotus follicularis]